MRLLIHGGAGTIPKTKMTPEKESDYHLALQTALTEGYKVLSANGSSLDAVRIAIQFMEDSPLFNAGYGSVITSLGTVELDAAIMDGKTLKAGAVAGISRTKNPILLAQKIMEQSEHVMLIGQQAEVFAEGVGILLIENDKLITSQQLKKWQDYKNNTSGIRSEHEKHGTVGAVALDSFGNLAAGTSTGGMMNKLAGRVGDSPIIGAGTYADNNTCAISMTGHGEYVMRLVLAHDIAAQMKYKRATLKKAAADAIHQLAQLGGTGGFIAIDKEGNFIMPFNTEGMYRGFIDQENIVTEIY